MNVIIRSGVHPTRWGTALQVLLEKIAGVCLVEKLRSIQLYEADLNWFMKFVFNDGAMSALQAVNYLPEEHYSRKQSTAEDACLDKTLTFDISWQSHTPMAIMSVDAAQCYDRVHHGLMSLVWLALIRDLPVVQILLSCLGDMKIYTRTGYGDSESFFGGRGEIPACGLGQGSKAAPASWVQLSSILVKIYKEMGFGAKLYDPVTKVFIQSIGCMFVDDTDLYEFESKLRSALDVYMAAQKAISLWSSLLAATGGAIKTEKSFWCLLDYVCNEGVWENAPLTHYPLTITLDGKDEVIAQHDMSDAVKTLGVFHCPAGGHTKHLENMRMKVLEWLGQMKNGKLPPGLVWRSYRLQLMKRIGYALGTLSNSLEAAEGCLRDVDYMLLPLLNVNRHVRTGWRRLHQSFGGIGLLHLPTEQLICRVNILQQHFATNSTIGLKLSCSLHWLQIQLGHDDNPLLLDYSKWGKLTCRSWWVELWESLHGSSIRISLRYKRQLRPRQNDRTIMETLMEQKLPMNTMISMNRCRIYLHVLFMSEICTADGKYIDKCFLGMSPSPVDSLIEYPREEPTRNDWKIWRSTWYGITSQAGNLRSPLGDWINSPQSSWRWVYLQDENQVANISKDCTHIFKCNTHLTMRSGDRYEYTYSTKRVVRGTPISISLNVDTTESHIVTIQSHSMNEIPETIDKDEAFWNTLREGGGEWMWESIHFEDSSDTSVEWIARAMETNSSIWVTDGSHFSQQGPYVSGAAWVVMDTDTGKKLACSFAEYSPDASSYRAETLGLYSIHAFIKAIHDHFQLGPSSVEICCDNDAALKEAQKRRRRIQAGKACSDVFRGIRKITQEMASIQLEYTWVKAHMDDVLEWTELTPAQQLNVMCDDLAKAAARKAIQQHPDFHIPPTQLLPHEQIAVYVDSFKQTTDPGEAIRYSCSKTLARRFLTTEIRWSTTQFDAVDWDNLHGCLNSKPDGFRTWLAKQHSNFCATGVQMKRWFHAEDSSCPSCGAPDERAEHLCRCKNDDRRKLLMACTTDLVQWMSIGENTHPNIITWVGSYILGHDNFPTIFNHPPSDLRELVNEQREIGWRNFMEGRISKQFFRVQFCHLIHARSRITAEAWTRTFISKILHITHSQWIFRNFMLHGKTHGILRLREQEAVLLQVEELMLSEKDNIPEDSRFLLEFDLGRLERSDYETQCYWVAAVTAARVARLGQPNLDTTPTERNELGSRSRRTRAQQDLPARTDPPLVLNTPRQRPSPAVRYAREDSNRARKPD